MARYIDLDKLKKKKKYSFQTVFGAFPKHEYFIKFTDLLEMPTADVKEVRRGEWEETSDYLADTIYRCSECGEEFVTIDGTPADNLWHYCPNCGAKMDKEES